ncbi:hypothetical protein J4G37_26550 [Microvirga sp. 3-52]|nr:hypothetical protein [Microvirga sp. 3-52]
MDRHHGPALPVPASRAAQRKSEWVFVSRDGARSAITGVARVIPIM